MRNVAPVCQLPQPIPYRTVRPFGQASSATYSNRNAHRHNPCLASSVVVQLARLGDLESNHPKSL